MPAEAFLRRQGFGGQVGESWWRRWESNPCPKYNENQALHAYPSNILQLYLEGTAQDAVSLVIFPRYKTKNSN
jgi:hypothetical protein